MASGYPTARRFDLDAPSAGLSLRRQISDGPTVATHSLQLGRSNANLAFPTCAVWVPQRLHGASRLAAHRRCLHRPVDLGTRPLVPTVLPGAAHDRGAGRTRGG